MANLSAGAVTILQHFHAKRLRQMDYELPAILAALFNDPQECEAAEEELEAMGLVTLGRAPPAHIPVPHRVRAAALTLEGERFLQRLAS